jgi:hypothetical protein
VTYKPSSRATSTSAVDTSDASPHSDNQNTDRSMSPTVAVKDEGNVSSSDSNSLRERVPFTISVNVPPHRNHGQQSSAPVVSLVNQEM